MKVKSESEVTQSCLTLSNPMDYSPSGSFVHGIFQARVLGCHRLLLEDRDCTFFPVSLVRNNNIILVGKADQFLAALVGKADLAFT